MKPVDPDKIWTFSEIKAFLERDYAYVKADDKRFGRNVHIVLDDGSALLYDSAFVEEINLKDKDWIVICTEHHGLCIYDKDDVLSIRQYERVEIVKRTYWID